jgi:hypothetical protein
MNVWLNVPGSRPSVFYRLFHIRVTDPNVLRNARTAAATLRDLSDKLPIRDQIVAQFCDAKDEEQPAFISIVQVTSLSFFLSFSLSLH